MTQQDKREELRQEYVKYIREKDESVDSFIDAIRLYGHATYNIWLESKLIEGDKNSFMSYLHENSIDLDKDEMDMLNKFTIKYESE